MQVLAPDRRAPGGYVIIFLVWLWLMNIAVLAAEFKVGVVRNRAGVPNKEHGASSTPPASGRRHAGDAAWGLKPTRSPA